MKNKSIYQMFIALFSVIAITVALPILSNAATNDPVAISNEKDFAKIEQNPDGNFYLSNDISFTGKYTLENKGTFTGVLDGRGHTVKNAKGLYLVSYINKGEIKNLSLENSTFSKSGIAYYNQGTIENCRVTSTTLETGICYTNNGLLENCKTDETDGSMCLLNAENGIIRKCINLSDISTSYTALSETSSGGIACKNANIIESCINKGAVHSTDNAGGICPLNSDNYNSTGISNCANYGSVTSTNHAYGIGQSTKVSNCINFGTVKGNGSNARGIGSYAYSCVNAGTVNNGSGYAVDYLGVKSQSYALSTSGVNDYYNKTTLISKSNFSNQSSFSSLDFDNVWKISNSTIALQSLDSEKIGISIYTLPKKANYNYGEKFDSTGLKVMSFNSFGEWAFTDNFTVSGFKGTVGKNTITVKCGNFSEKFDTYVYEDITDSKITYDDDDIMYTNGGEVYPDITVVSPNGRTLVNGKDYTVTYQNNRAPGIGTIKITGTNYCTGSLSSTFTIKEKLNDSEIKLNKSEYTENGTPITPDFSVYNCMGAKLIPGVDYTVNCKNNVAPGQAVLEVTGIGYYENTISTQYQIWGNLNLANININPSAYIVDDDYTYPQFTVTSMLGTLLYEGVDYYVYSYYGGNAVGTATVTIEGMGLYKGGTSADYTILPRDITNYTLTLSGYNFIANGEKIQPKVTLVDQYGNALEGITDYTVTYQNNIYPGTATVTVTGRGKYTGTKTVNFTISPIDISGYRISFYYNSTSFYADGTAIMPSIKVYTPSGSELWPTSNYTVEYINNVYPGTATLTVTGCGLYSGTISANYSIILKQVDGIYTSKRTNNSLKLKWDKVFGAKKYVVEVYNSKKKKWKVYKTVTSESVTISKLSPSTAYNIRIKSYCDDIYSNYSSTATIRTLSSGSSSKSTKSKYSPKKVTGVKATVYTHHSTKQFKVNYKKVKNASGYQIEYLSINGKYKRLANIKKGSKTGYVSKWSDWSFDMSRPVIRVRAYKTVKGKKYYSAWTKVKPSVKSK